MISPKSAEQADIFELYSLAVEMADRVSARRGTANSFFLTVHTGLATFLGIRVGSVAGSGAHQEFGLVLGGGIGLVLAGTWWVLLRSYRDLNTAKYAVITRIEEEHFVVRPFSEEWATLKGDPIKPWRKRYAELGFIERAVPIVFAVTYLATAIKVVA